MSINLSSYIQAGSDQIRVANTYLQAFVANTNSYIASVQSDVDSNEATERAALANTNSYIATKVNTSTFNSALANTNSYIATVSATERSALANTNSYIATKVSTSTFNSALANTNSYIAAVETREAAHTANTLLHLANTNSYIATKVSTSTFNSALANTNSYIATVQSDVDSNEATERAALANTNSYIATKANIASPTFTGTLTYATLNDGTTNLTSTVAELNTLDGITATTAELNYTDGVTSNIQTQLNAKAALASPALTGTATAVNLTISGDLTVNGTTTTLNTTNTVVSDNLIELNNGVSSNANDSGIVIERGSTGDNAFMGWDESADGFILGTTTATGASTGDLTVTAAPLTVGSLTSTGTVALNDNSTETTTVNGRLQVIAGTAGSPGIRGSSDTDTGINIGIAANEIGFVTGGTERLRIDSNGDLSIPNTNKFYFKNADGSLDAYIWRASGNGFRFVNPANATIIDMTGNHDFEVRNSNDQTAFSVDVNGTASSTVAYVGGNRILTVADEGSGNGLDADTLDGVEGASYLRSDAVDVGVTLELNGGSTYDPTSTGAGSDTATDVGLALGTGIRIVGHYSGYIRSLLEWNVSSDITIGQSGTSFIGGINLLPGSSGDAKVSGWRILTVADEGSGNGLDADTLDGVERTGLWNSSSYSFAVGEYTGLNTYYSSGWKITSSQEGAYAWRNGGNGVGLQLFVQDGSVTAGGTFSYNEYQWRDGDFYSSTNKFWHAGNDGAGSGLDADTLDGVQGASYLRSDTNDSFTGSAFTFFSGTPQLNIENQSTFARMAFNKLTFWDWTNSKDIVIFDGQVTVDTSLNVGTAAGTTTNYLYLHGSTANKKATLYATNGNLHVDADSGNGIYLNWYTGTTGTYFGNGSSGQVARIDNSGNITYSGSLTGDLKDYSETSTTANSSTAYTVNMELGNVFNITMTGNCTFTFSNPPASGKAGTITMILTQDGTGSRTATWPAAVKWAGGTAPTLSTGAADIDIIAFLTVDGGTTWFGMLGGNNFS